MKESVAVFFRRAGRFKETKFERFVEHAGVKKEVILEVFARDAWAAMRDDWLRARARKVMDELYPLAVMRDDFTRNRVRKRIGVGYEKFDQVVGPEWQKLAEQLPTGQEIVLAKLAEMVAANVSLEELTVQKLCKAAGVMAKFGPWLGDKLREARRELKRRQKETPAAPPHGVDARQIPGGWLDLNDRVWDLKLHRSLLERDRLRPDVADIAWPILREELQVARLSLSTVQNHYRGYLYACDVLGAEVPDVRLATLESVQRSWSAYRGTRPQREAGRAALIQIFSAIFGGTEKAPDSLAQEMRGIIIWLRTKVKLPADAVEREFLSEAELDHLIFCCLSDIKVGMEFCAKNPDLLAMSTRPDNSNGAAPVVNWTAALMILLMIFTGLRHSSVTALKLNDWMEINAKFSSIVWRHDKKMEEHMVFTPVLLIRLLECYVHQTAKVREAVGTKRIFLVGNHAGDWYACPDTSVLTRCLRDFVERHGLSRYSKPLPLNSTVLRRTYATHQLYKGRSLWFIRAQLGHESIAHTKDYAQFDRYEHPAHVGEALDEYGRRVLSLWHRPADPKLLDSEGRAHTYRDTEAITNDDSVVPDVRDAATGDNLLPCSTCPELITGGEYIQAWEKELSQREERLQKVTSDPESSAEEIEAEGREFERFMKNYELVKRDSENVQPQAR